MGLLLRVPKAEVRLVVMVVAGEHAEVNVVAITLHSKKQDKVLTFLTTPLKLSSYPTESLLLK